jgi:hypothetical protein
MNKFVEASFMKWNWSSRRTTGVHKSFLQASRTTTELYEEGKKEI